MLEQFLLSPLKRTEPKVIFDLTQVESVSSAGLRMFLTVARAYVKAKRTLVFVCPKTSITQSFISSGFGMLFDFYADLDLAKAALEQHL